ncbi:hypothetical protein shim_05190 [Shimia sp. SK013]|uniref:hypothetical protein n=1 Tax=Shimia sp. SK013 TaxID=1389006 RepID=UPI0006B66D81|nr:hypothetical protein [Shimia sp. SK013]KPA23324.1 hypothetical protein shim_05190 [Shimia sp. SK013]
MIWNIIDKRNRPYRWRTINAIIEDVAHDNGVADAGPLDEANNDAPVYDELRGASLHDAVAWAETHPGKVTLYLYDDGDGF